MPATRARLIAITIAVLMFAAGCAPSVTDRAPSADVNVTALEVSPLCSSSKQAVAVPDEAVADIIRSNLRLGDADPLTCADLAELDEVTVERAASLEGLQFANNLKGLTLVDSRLDSLEPLAGNESVTSLVVRGGNLTSLDPLAGSPRLGRLEVTDNALHDISALARLPELSSLKLTGNAISDVSALAQHGDLLRLDLSDNQIRDLTPLASISSLVMLKLNGNEVEDASPLAELPRLGWIELADNDLTGMEFISDLRIERLDLAGNRIISVSPLARSLSLSSSGYFDLRQNCIDLTDPFVQDLLVRDLNVALEPQAECAESTR